MMVKQHKSFVADQDEPRQEALEIRDRWRFLWCRGTSMR